MGKVGLPLQGPPGRERVVRGFLDPPKGSKARGWGVLASVVATSHVCL